MTNRIHYMSGSQSNLPRNERGTVFNCALFFSVQLSLVTALAQNSCVQFNPVPADKSGIDFKNVVVETEELNLITHMNHWNGGGVAVADINNDGLQDIFLSSNLDGVRLYLNKGNLSFVDRSEEFGLNIIPKAWTSGLSTGDFDQDGWIDVFVSRRALHDNRNYLLRNTGRGKFIDVTESVGLLDTTNSTQALFFDFDNDGDVDIYLLNNDEVSIVAGAVVNSSSSKVSRDRLYLQENKVFVDRSELIPDDGKIQLGLGVTAGDFDWNGSTDIYVSNDLHSADKLLINEGGSFRNKIFEMTGHTSLNSMGCAVGDLDNDLWPDIHVVDMLSDNELERKIRGNFSPNKVRQIGTFAKYIQIVQNTYFRNVFGKCFSEVAMITGLHDTDWSWSNLIFDMNNDGLNDLFVTNSLKRNLMDLDYTKFQLDVVKNFNPRTGTDHRTRMQVVDSLPPMVLTNHIFLQNKDLTFSRTTDCDFLKVNSNGAAIGDLDNDGDLDIIINNFDSTATLLENRIEAAPNWIQIRFAPEIPYSSYVHCNAIAYSCNTAQLKTMSVNNGFQSTSQALFHFGLGDCNTIDSVLIILNGNQVLSLSALMVNQIYTVSHSDFLSKSKRSDFLSQLKIGSSVSLEHGQLLNVEDWHNEVRIDFGNKMNRLNFKGPNKIPPALAVEDFNNDGLEDVYLSTENGFGKIFTQMASTDATIRFTNSEISSVDHILYQRRYAIHCATPVDFDNDGDIDIIAAGRPNPPLDDERRNAPLLFVNDGNGNFSVDVNSFDSIRFPIAEILAHDFDRDGNTDICFLGDVLVENYPRAAPSTQFTFESGKWKNKSESIEFPLGICSDASIADMNNDGNMDIVICLENKVPYVLLNSGAEFERPKRLCPDIPNGFWSAMKIVDIDNDGDLDVVLGNLGRNILPIVSRENPLILFNGDLNGNGKTDPLAIHTDRFGNVHFLQGRDDLLKQVPELRKHFQNYASFAEASVSSIIPDSLLKTSVDSVFELRNAVIINDGKGNFLMVHLPLSTEYGKVNAIYTANVDADSIPDVVLFGNTHNFNSAYGFPDGNSGIVVHSGIDSNGMWYAKSVDHLGVRGIIQDALPIQVGLDSYIILANSSGNTSFIKLIPNHNK